MRSEGSFRASVGRWAVALGCPRSIGLNCDADGAALLRTDDIDDRVSRLDSEA